MVHKNKMTMVMLAVGIVDRRLARGAGQNLEVRKSLKFRRTYVNSTIRLINRRREKV